MSANPDAVSGQGDQFHSRVKPSEHLKDPVVSFNCCQSMSFSSLTAVQHKPGVMASERDKAPEFHAQAVPQGTAPPDRLFKPNTASEAPPTSDSTGEGDAESTEVSASDTLGGATSKDVHTGLGKPMQGETSAELRHDGQHGRKKEKLGLAGTGASEVGQGGKQVDPHEPEFANQRGLDKEEARSGRDKAGAPLASDRVPQSATDVAREAPGK